MATSAAGSVDTRDTLMEEPVGTSSSVAANRGDDEEGDHDDFTMLRPMPQPPERTDVAIVGAGPTGLMLGAVLSRFGIKVQIIDERADQTAVGRADGLQPKTIETLKMLRLGDDVLRHGAKVFDFSLWRTSAGAEPIRVGRQPHYPSSMVDVLHPFMLLCHQGMVERIFVDDLRRRGVEVKRSHQFESYSAPSDGEAGPLKINCRWNVTHDEKIIFADYLVGCDGARSQVRKSIPGTFAAGAPQDSVWGVLDGEIDTDFPDIWTKTVVYSEEHGSVLMMPRERNQTRLYIELKGSVPTPELGQRYVMGRAQQILAPFRISWRSVEWFGRYQVGQRVAARFADERGRAFIAGDAAHTHSPKASQGMNTSMHDAWNLAWKLNLAVRGLARPALLESYGLERKKIAHDLINFDYEHVNHIAMGDADALVQNFRTNVRFISGVGVVYGENAINNGHDDVKQTFDQELPGARPGCNLPPAKVKRYIDDNPVDIQLDIPVLGQFRVYVFLQNVCGAGEAAFLDSFSKTVASESSLIVRLSAAAYRSYLAKPRLPGSEDLYIRPERYTRLSHLFTFALITFTEKSLFELASLPPLFSESKWTVYTDNAPELDTQGLHCWYKWLGQPNDGEVVILNVRPDGYVGSLKRWANASEEIGVEAAQWLDSYYDGFLQVPSSEPK